MYIIRWLTTANSILRLYVQTKKPSNILKVLVSYIVNVYAVSFFEIKENSDIRFGSVHFFNQINGLRGAT